MVQATTKGGPEIWVSKGKRKTVVAMLNTGKKAGKTPAINIGDVGFIPYIGNKITIDSDILSTAYVPGTSTPVNDYSTAIPAGRSLSTG